MNRFLASVALVLAAASFPAGGTTAETFIDARSYPTPTAGRERFLALETRLVRGFDEVCGDTFCEGEYHNLQSLRFRCSVNAADGGVEECVWTFTGSTAQVDGSSGRIIVDARSWACPVPLAARTPLPILLQALEQDDPLHVRLPGTTTNLYEGLTGCL